MKLRAETKTFLILVLLTFALYARTAGFPFCGIDDPDYVSENTHVSAGLTLHSIKWAFTSFHASNWHPLTWLSLMTDTEIFGTRPAGYHLTNALLHALGSGLLFLLFNAVTGAFWRSAFVAACFAAHPLHVESVAWISERKDVLSGVFWMLTLICYASYARSGKKGRYLLSLALFALGLMSKPMLVTIPVVLLLLDFWPLQRAGGTAWGRLLAEKAPYLLLALGSSAITISAQSHGGAVASLASYPVGVRVNNALWSLLSYLGKMFFPVDLAIYYPFVPVPAWKAGGAFGVVALATWFCIRKNREYPWLAAGWGWYLVTLLPVIGLVQVGGQAMADRYTYLPYIGLFTIAGWGGWEAAARLRVPRQAVAVCGGAVVSALSVVTWMQMNYWQDNLRLLSHAVSITPRNYVASYALALAYKKAGDRERAVEQFLRAIESYPQNPDLHQLHLHAGNLLNEGGRHAEAIPHFEEALRLKPRFWQALNNKGLALEWMGKTDEAIGCYEGVLQIKPGDAGAHNNIGRILARRGTADAAQPRFKSLPLKLVPASPHFLDLPAPSPPSAGRTEP